MTPAWQWSDLDFGTFIGGFIALIMAYSTWDTFSEIWQMMRGKQRFQLRKMLYAMLALPMTLVIGWVSFMASNRHRLLRGERRYTVAIVDANHYFKGGKVSYYTYWVNGNRYTGQQEVDFIGGYRPLGSRWFLRFAAADPSVHEQPGQAVPDNLTQIPVSGWITQPPVFSPTDPVPDPTLVQPAQSVATPRPASTPNDSAAKPAPTHPTSPLFLKPTGDSTAKPPTPQAHPFLPQVSPRRP